MKTIMLWALVGLNVVLLAMLVGVGDEKTALAQSLRRGEYIMAPGQLAGGSTEVVFILDTRNGRLTFAAQGGTNNNSIASSPYIDLNRVFEPGRP